MVKSWTLRPGAGPDSLTLKEIDQEPLGAGQVRVALKAWSLNARDIMVAFGQSPVPVADELIPLSDAAGLVVEVGDGVSRVAAGDRVVVTFNPAHQSGAFEPYMGAHAFGEMNQGLLSQERVLDQMALVKLPNDISFQQAACLPCATVTAWNALFGTGSLLPGQTALATGTGSVSLIALKLAKAAGARVGITSSDNAKLDRAISIGADFGINYQAKPNWDQDVRVHTGGGGADVIVETAGPPSIAASVRAVAQNGRVAQIGLKSMDGPAISMLDVMLGGVRIVPVMVGSRVMLEQVIRAVSANAISLPVHNNFSFDDARAAFSEQMSGAAFGKVTLSLE